MMFLYYTKRENNMKTINATIERAKDGTFTVYCDNEIFSGAGKTLQEAKDDMKAQMSFYKETALSEGFKYPDFLDEEYTITYSVDATSILRYYIGSGIFSLAGMEKISGINQKQLWSYLNGVKPQKRQKDRIVSGLKKLSADMNMIFA